MLDINLFREDKSGPEMLEMVRESQRRRMPDNLEEAEASVQAVLREDKAWREARWGLDRVATERNVLNKELRGIIIALRNAENPESVDPDGAKEASIKEKKDALEEREKNFKHLLVEAEERRTVALAGIGNLVHASVPVHHDEDEGNTVARVWPLDGEQRPAAGGQERNHVDLLHMIDGVEYTRGVSVSGSRGYFLKGPGVLLNLALVQYGLKYMVQKGYTPIQTPFFMDKAQMAKCAQLGDFDEQLYKVSGDGEKYLIATSEQPMCAYHADEWVAESELPRKFIGHSTCFRKEAGSHGRDQLGIFRVHQFDKLEQFCVTSPDDNKSWEMLDELMANAEEFYQSLGLSYQVVNIASGALNDAAAKKFDLEAWFPGSKAYRELVSCSNCTDYQSRMLKARCGTKKMGDTNKRYVHMLNSTLCATSRVICCILETYQDDTGVKVPEVLQPFVGAEHLPFVRPPPKLKIPKSQQQ